MKLRALLVGLAVGLILSFFYFRPAVPSAPIAAPAPQVEVALPEDPPDAEARSD